MTGADYAWLFISAAAVLVTAMVCLTYLKHPWLPTETNGTYERVCQIVRNV